MTDPTCDNQEATTPKPAIYITDANFAVEDDWVAGLFHELDGIDVPLVVSTSPDKLITRTYVNDNNKPTFSSHAFVESYRRVLVDVLFQSSARIGDIHALSTFDGLRLMAWNERIGTEGSSTIHGLNQLQLSEKTIGYRDFFHR
ncbi:hypothetical protein AWENTII_005240 [Aspergillus wentii]|nr:hypothetical protein MW887_008708 [Aspergillus wentii]